MSTPTRFEDPSVLVSGIYSKLTSVGAQAATHRESASRKLCRLRDILVREDYGEHGELSQNDLILLTTAGIMASRRDDEDSATSASLVFVLLCLCSSRRGTKGNQDPSVLDEIGSLKSLLGSPGVWNESDIVSQKIGRGVYLLTNGTLEDMRPYASSFYLSSAAILQQRLLDAGDDDFLSLTLHKRQENTQAIESIIAAADSEAGQVVLRDMMLSFTLPMTLVGVRRTLPLARETSHIAMSEHPAETQEAHGIAMQGATWVWDRSEDETTRTVSILTGLACLLTREGPDPIRKADAFGGRVCLPFIQQRAPSNNGLTRMSLDRWTNRWCLYRLEKGQKPDILASGGGLEGLIHCAVGLVGDV
mgnify:CR=1 FL=1